MTHLIPWLIILIGTSLASLMASAELIPAGRVWERVDTRDSQAATSFLVDGETTYVIGEGGVIWTSEDREIWQAQETRVTENLTAITKGSETIVVVGEEGRILAGPGDGEWIAAPSGVTLNLNAVTYGAGRFVAVGKLGVILSSPDGMRWTGWASGTTENLEDVMWDGSSFHVVGRGATVASSTPDGSWEIHPRPFPNFLNGNFETIQFFKDEYIINGILYSDDGVTYQLDEGSRPVTVNEVTSGAGLIAGLVFGGKVAVSEDSREWDTTDLPPQNLVEIKYSGSEFLAMTPARQFFRTVEGLDWTENSKPPSIPRTSSDLLDVVHSPWGFLAIGQGGNVLHSLDGRTWTRIETGVQQLNALCVAEGKVIAVGEEIVMSENGLDWQIVESESPWEGYTDIRWNGEILLAVGSNNGGSGDGMLARSVDGTTWETVTFADELTTVVWTGEMFIAATKPGAHYFSEDGVDWELKVLPRDITSHAFGNGIHLVGTRKGSFYRSENGETWEVAYTRRGPLTVEESAGATSRLDFVNGLFFAGLTSEGSISAVSKDGISWSGTFANQLTTVVWTGTEFLGIGGSFRLLSSDDGIEWTTRSTDFQSGDPIAAVWNGSELIAVGTRGSAFSLGEDDLWDPLPSGTTKDLTHLLWFDGQAVALDDSGGIVFFGQGSDLPAGFVGNWLLESNGHLVVAGEEGQIAVLNEGSWEIVDTGAGASLQTITKVDDTLWATGDWSTIVQSESLNPGGPWNLKVRSGRQDASLDKLEFLGGELIALRIGLQPVNSIDGFIWEVDDNFRQPWSRAVIPGEESELLSLGRGGSIFRIGPGGDRIIEVSGTTLDLHAAARNEDMIVAVGEDGVILVSQAGGTGAQGYQSYITQVGGFSQGALPGADWDQDGVSNFLEYLLGLDSEIGSFPDPINDLVAISSDDSGIVLELEINTDFADAEIRIMRSRDLITWQEVATKSGGAIWTGSANVAEISRDEQISLLEVRDQIDDEASFYRLEVAPR